MRYDNAILETGFKSLRVPGMQTYSRSAGDQQQFALSQRLKDYEHCIAQ